MSIIQKYNPISGNFDLIHSEDSFDDITVVANYSALPAVATVMGRFYWCSASQGTSWLPGSLGGTYYSAGMYYSNGTTWEFLDVPYQATLTEVNTGTNDNKFITPLTLTNATVITNKAKKTIQVTSQTLLAANWTLVSGLYEYDLANANIKALNFVEVIPDNATISITKAADLLPTNVSSSGSVKLYSTNLPTGDIVVTINIYE